MTRWVWVGCLAGLLPWIAAAIFTDWFNELQSNGVRTLSVGHAIVLLAAQLGIGLIVLVCVRER